jgi:hypothetical protein
MSGIRRGTPPVEEDPKTWVQLVFFPLSVIALTFMAAMLLIYIWSTWLVEPRKEPHEVYSQAPPIPIEFPKIDHSAPIDAPPEEAEQRPSGGIVIEK